METLKITAELYNGFVSSDAWSPTLDGILAYWQLRLADPDGFLTRQGRSDLMEPADGLPLEKIYDGDRWWWASSAPIYQAAQVQRVYFHRRFDDQHERFLPEGTKSVLTAAGPYKCYRKSVLLRVTNEVSWHCVGDEVTIQELLNHCHHIGGKPAQGYGRVKRWSIARGDAQLARLHRPLPVAYAERFGVTGPVMRWGIRPPGRIAENQIECVMPT